MPWIDPNNGRSSRSSTGGLFVPPPNVLALALDDDPARPSSTSRSAFLLPSAFSDGWTVRCPSCSHPGCSEADSLCRDASTSFSQIRLGAGGLAGAFVGGAARPDWGVIRLG